MRSTGVLVRLKPLANGQRGSCAALPHELDGSAVVVAVDVENDVDQECAQQLLSVLVGGGASVPDRAEVARDPPQGAPLSVRERRWLLAISDGSAAVICLGQCLLKRGLQRSSDETVLRLTGIELALAAAGLKLSLLDGELCQSHSLLMLGLELIDRASVAWTLAGLTACRNAETTVLSSRRPPIDWHGRRVPWVR